MHPLLPALFAPLLLLVPLGGTVAADTPRPAEVAYEALRVQEKALIAEVQALDEACHELEEQIATAAAPPIPQEQQRRNRQEALLSEKITALVKERLTNSARAIKLATEVRVLRGVFDDILSGGTSERVGLEVLRHTLQQLAASKSILPTTTTFASHQALRNATAERKLELTAASEKDRERRAVIDEKLRVLDEELDQLRHLPPVEDAQGEEAAARQIKAWFDALARLAAKREALEAVRAQLLAQHWQAVVAARGLGPPHLKSVRVDSTHHGPYYHAGWQDDGPGIQRMYRNQETLQAQIVEQRALVSRIRNLWHELAAERLPLVRQMHGIAKLMPRLGLEYGEQRQLAIYTAATTDVVVALTTTLLTGGALPAANALDRLILSYSQKHAKPIAEAAAAATRNLSHLSPAARALPAIRPTGSVPARVAQVEVAAIEAARSALRRAGTPARGAATETRALLERIKVRNALVEQDGLLKSAWNKAITQLEELPSATGGAAQTAATLSISRLTPTGWLQERSISAAIAGTATSDLIGLGAQTAHLSYLGQRVATPSAAKFTALKDSLRLQNLKKALAANALTVVVTAVGTVVKGVFTAAMEGKANAALQEFWARDAQIRFLGRMLRALQAVDRPLHAVLNDARKDLAMLEATYAATATPPIWKQWTAGYLDKPGGDATLRLTFSARMTRPPLAKLGTLTIPMGVEGAVPGKPIFAYEFVGTIPVARLPEGALTLEVSLAEDTEPHARLDSDPSTVPILLSPALRDWRNVDPGPDRRHVIRKDLEVHRTLEVLDGLLATLHEGAGKSEERYGSGSRDSGLGWTGMSRSLEAAHRRIGADVRGDPHGAAWMSYNDLGLKGAGSSRYVGPLEAFRGLVAGLGRAMHPMTDDHRAYLAHVRQVVGSWEAALPRLETLSNTWLDTLATFTAIGAELDAARRNARTEANHEALDRIEDDLKGLLPAPLTPYETWLERRSEHSR